jgi:hypothetical protein
MTKILTINKIIFNVFAKSMVLLVYALGKGLMKLASQHNNRIEISVPESVSSDLTIKNLGLKK